MLRSLWHDRVAPFLTRFNSHHVMWTGVVLAILSIGAVGGRDQLDLWVTAHFDGLAAVGRAYVDGAAAVGLYVIWPAIIAAALGRPPNIPGSPKP